METSVKDLRVGVIGAGSMGRHHVRILSGAPDVTMVGFYDPDPARAAEVSRTNGQPAFESLGDLLDRVNAVTVAAPTSLHAEIGEQCLRRKIHTLIEKPLAHDVESAARLVDLARESGVTLMVGHVERYNPAVRALTEHLGVESDPVIAIQATRLAPFDGTRCIDVDVLLDLLIHDIDLALEIAAAPVVNVSAVGRPVYSPQTDEAHTRITFANGVTAIFWTGKCSPKKVRSLVVTTPRRRLEVDTLTRSLTIYCAEQTPAMENGLCLMGGFTSEAFPVPDEEPLRVEIEDFLRSVREGRKPIVDAERALSAMKVLELARKSIAADGQICEA